MCIRFMYPLVLIATVGAREYSFRITKLIVPDTVPPEVNEVEIECSYDFTNFTEVRWLKDGQNEFFIYKSREDEEKRFIISPIIGVGKVEVVKCDLTACKLRLRDLMEYATGSYRCEVDRVVPPYHYDTQTAYMHVSGPQKQPVLEGLAEEFSNGQEMYANCKGVPYPKIRWYINGQENKTMRGSPRLKINASKLLFSGLPPVVTIQCAQYRYGNPIFSNEMQARWKTDETGDYRPEEKGSAAPNQWVNIIGSWPFGGQYAGFLRKVLLIISKK